MQMAEHHLFTTAPVAEKQRIASIDVLRGFAVLGILLMNIQAFSMIEAAYMNPTAYGDLTGVNFWVWALSHVFADQKFISIFSMLFGAGIVLMTGKAESTGRPALLHYRRMGWLILFGLMHAYLLWYGEILFIYGVCGLLVYFFRKKSPLTLLILGFVFMSIASLIFLSLGISMQFWSEEAVREMGQDWQPSQELVQAEVKAYQGGWLDQMSFRVPAAFLFHTVLFLMLGWKIIGLMLFGMGLFKLGVFSAERSGRFYWNLVSAGVFVGIPVIILGMVQNFSHGWSMNYSFFFGGQFNYWGSLLVALGWIGAVMLVYESGSFPAVNQRLSAVGRMAFTNYILQTIFCTTIFYGHGFGLFGKVERIGQIAVVFAVWILQLIVSPIWLRHFSFGPLEWLWRSLTYWKMPAMKR